MLDGLLERLEQDGRMGLSIAEIELLNRGALIFIEVAGISNSEEFP